MKNIVLTLTVAALLGGAIGYSLPASATLTKNTIMPLTEAPYCGPMLPPCDEPGAGLNATKYCCGGTINMYSRNGRWVEIYAEHCKRKTASPCSSLWDEEIDCAGIDYEAEGAPSANGEFELWCVNED